MLAIFSKHLLISFKFRTKLNILNKCCPSYCSCLNASQIVETGETDDKCTNLLKYSCYACYIDFFSFFAKLDMLITTIGIITIGTGMLGTTFGMEIVMIIKKTSVFIERTRNNTYIYFHLSILTMPEMT